MLPPGQNHLTTQSMWIQIVQIKSHSMQLIKIIYPAKRDISRYSNEIENAHFDIAHSGLHRNTIASMSEM